MSLKKQTRKLHYWISPIIFIPVIIIFSTGVLLQFKKQSNWVQPNLKITSDSKPVMLNLYLETAKTVSEAEISSWDDIDRIDIRPNKGIAKIRSKNNWEIQLDLESADIYSVSFRRSDIIESVHDGSFFSDYVKFGLFLPSGILLIVLSFTGIYMFIIPILKNRKKGKS
ncbi:MAG: PepSY domain-containing protein [Candidatus Neomarinimicrobiota bacterium]